MQKGNCIGLKDRDKNLYKIITQNKRRKAIIRNIFLGFTWEIYGYLHFKNQ